MVAFAHLALHRYLSVPGMWTPYLRRAAYAAQGRAYHGGTRRHARASLSVYYALLRRLRSFLSHRRDKRVDARAGGRRNSWPDRPVLLPSLNSRAHKGTRKTLPGAFPFETKRH